MKLGVANRINILDIELDDTIDVRITYSDIIGLLLIGEEETDSLATLYLNGM